MSAIGRFLEFGVAAHDILESLHFYKTLGFTELETADVYPLPCADGLAKLVSPSYVQPPVRFVVDPEFSVSSSTESSRVLIRPVRLVSAPCVNR